ncbi:MAG: TolC family protein [Bacteroidia bacterium]|jgi:outer membrane protein
MKKSILILFLFITASAFSQTTNWSLKQCIEHALKNNLQVKQAEFNKDISEQNLLQTKANVLPNLSLNASNFYNFGQTIDPFTNRFATSRVRSDRFSLQTGMNIFSGFQQYNSIKQGELNLFASKQDLDKIKNDVALSIASSYLQILFAIEQLKNAQNQTTITKQQIERANRLLEAGSAAKNILLDLQAQLANEDLSVINAQNQLDISYLNLALQLDLKSTQDFSIEIPELADPTSELITANADYIYTTAIGNQPAVKSSETRIKVAEKGVNIAQSGLYPTISIGGSLGTGYSGLAQDIIGYQNQQYIVGQTLLGESVYTTQQIPIFEPTKYSKQLNSNFNRSFGFQLSWSLFNGLNNYTNINRAKLNFEISKNNLDQTKRDLKQTIFNAYYDAVAALKKYNATKTALTASELAFNNTKTRFDLGVVNSFEFNDSKNKLNLAKSNLNQAKFDYIFKVKILDFYQGKPITL